MESEVIQTLAGCLQANTPVALVTVIASTGSSPGKTGAMMIVQTNGHTYGTVGGGSLEHQVIEQARQCLTTGENKEVRHSLNPGGELGMSCGGELRLFIKVFQPLSQLLVIGAGHIGLELYQLGLHQGFRVVVVDDRAEMVTEERFSQAERICSADLARTLAELPVGGNWYITIATRSHDTDRQALAAVVNSEAAYIGMIGSRNKIRSTMHTLLKQGISREKLEAVYAPMGLNIASVQPREIAVSIISEILLVKNKGSLHHMRTIKDIHF